MFPSTVNFVCFEQTELSKIVSFVSICWWVVSCCGEDRCSWITWKFKAWDILIARHLKFRVVWRPHRIFAKIRLVHSITEYNQDPRDSSRAFETNTIASTVISSWRYFERYTGTLSVTLPVASFVQWFVAEGVDVFRAIASWGICGRFRCIGSFNAGEATKGTRRNKKKGETNAAKQAGE